MQTLRRASALLLIALLARAPVAFAQNQIGGPTLLTAQDTGACASAGMCATFALPRVTAVAFQITGTWSGTLTFQGTADGSTYVSLFVANAATGAQSTTTTANGVFTVNNPGFQSVRVVFTTRSSGTASVVLTQGYGIAIKSAPAFPSSFTAGDLLYASAANTISGLSDVATGQVLASGGVGAAPAYTANPTVTSIQVGDGTNCSAAAITFSAQTTTGFTRPGSGLTDWCSPGYSASNPAIRFQGGEGITIGNGLDLAFTPSSGAAGTVDTRLIRGGVGYLASTLIGTSGADVTSTNVSGFGDETIQRYQATITPASGGANNCATSAAGFKANSTNADCVIFTLAAGQKLLAAYADVTAGFTCSGTCTGTKTFGLGISAGGTEIFASGLNVAVTGTFGLADANMGSAMTRAAAIQGGYLPSWSSTTTLTARFVSGTGSWGNGSVTNVNAGSIKFTLITQQVK